MLQELLNSLRRRSDLYLLLLTYKQIQEIWKCVEFARHTGTLSSWMTRNNFIFKFNAFSNQWRCHRGEMEQKAPPPPASEVLPERCPTYASYCRKAIWKYHKEDVLAEPHFFLLDAFFTQYIPITFVLRLAQFSLSSSYPHPLLLSFKTLVQDSVFSPFNHY